VDWRTKDPVAFHRVIPDARATIAHGTKAARGTSFQAASDRAHFYVWAHKVVGSLHMGSAMFAVLTRVSHARTAPRRC